MAAAFRFTTTARDARDGARAKVAKLINLLGYRLAALFPFRKSKRHMVGLQSLTYHIRKEIRPKKDAHTTFHFYVAHPCRLRMRVKKGRYDRIKTPQMLEYPELLFPGGPFGVK